MYQLISIGKMQEKEGITFIELKNEYKMGLNKLVLFSHVHVFYGQHNSNKFNLNSSIMEVIAVDEKTGILHLMTRESFNKSVEVFDIKPYFPCEDSVKISSMNCKDRISEMRMEYSAEKSEFLIKEIGEIHNANGEKYIQLKERIQDLELITCTHIKIIWWFHKFDSAKYRRCVECNPPYENAPRTGVFASRSPVRPNPIAMTVARILKIDQENKRIYISEIECFDKTPCIGIVPYDKDRDLIEVAKIPEWLAHWPKWLDEGENALMEGDIAYRESCLEQILEEEQEVLISDIEKLQSSEMENVVDDGIYVKGARENNLKGVSVTIPYKEITAVIGVSGSGKSSLIQDTIYAECRRRMEYLSDDRSGLEKPLMEYMSGCMPAILISQKEIGRNSRSTVGTYSNAYDYLRMIYAAVGIRHCPSCGNEIIPMDKEKIVDLLEKINNVQIFDLARNEIVKGSVSKKVCSALEAGQGALYAKLESDKFVLLQTKQMCYRCNKLLFELTPATFNYMDVESRCQVCNGYGEISEIDITKIVEKPHLSILDGASLWWGKLRNFLNNPNSNWMKGQVIGLAEAMCVDLEQPWDLLPQEFKDKVIWGTDEEKVTFHYANKGNGREGNISRPVEGVYNIIKRLSEENNNADVINRYKKRIKCTCCAGEKLNAEGRQVSIGKIRYPQAAGMTFSNLSQFCCMLPQMVGHTRYELIKMNVQKLYEIARAAEILGIGYLEVDRCINTLSGGEGQRLKIMSAIQNRMTGVLYVFDEPSKGLHPKDYKKIAKLIESLKENGNTIVMVDHNEDMIKIADNIIEIGPKAGEDGGYLTGEGTIQAMKQHKGTQISEYFGKKNNENINQKKNVEQLSFIKLRHIQYNNLKNIDIKIPLEALTCIWGVSGSGKSSLMKGAIYSEFRKDNGVFDDVILVDQTAIGRTPRSVPATYIGIMDLIRSIFAQIQEARIRGYDESTFSFNGNGQCENCHGDGKIKLKYMDDSWITCPVCKGKRYKKRVMEVLYHGKSINDVLELSIIEAIHFFHEIKEIVSALNVLDEVGLGYLKLGQSSLTLSGGEASRLKLAKELMGKKKKKVLYLFDEPTTGLHFSDIENLLKLFLRLIDAGNTIVVVDHNKQILTCCNWIIELGPGAGKEGGSVIRQGSLEDSLFELI